MLEIRTAAHQEHGRVIEYDQAAGNDTNIAHGVSKTNDIFLWRNKTSMIRVWHRTRAGHAAQSARRACVCCLPASLVAR